MLYESPSEAEERLDADLCFLPDEVWESRLIMTLRAFFDESGHAPDQDVMVVAGLVASGAKWKLLVKDWVAACAPTAKTPQIDCVKYTEITSLKGQFSDQLGWTEKLRDERLQTFVDLIAAACRGRMHVSMSWALFQEYVQSIPAQSRTLINDSPYVMAANRAIVATASALDDLGLYDTCDIYFDETNGNPELLQMMWPQTKLAPNVIPSHLLRKPNKRPKLGYLRFGSDTDYPMLQAADLVAGAVRDATMGNPVLPQLAALNTIPCSPMIMDMERMKRSGEKMQETVRRLHEKYPHMPLYEYDAQTAKRTRKNLARKRKIGATKRAGSKINKPKKT